MNDIAKVVDTLPGDFEAKIDPLATQLRNLVKAIESLPELSGNVREIRDEFSGFRGFRDRVESYEKTIKQRTMAVAWAIVLALLGSAGAVIGFAYYVGGKASTVIAKVDDLTTSFDKLQATTVDLKVATAGHSERIKSLEESMRLAANTAESNFNATRRLTKSSDSFNQAVDDTTKRLARSVHDIRGAAAALTTADQRVTDAVKIVNREIIATNQNMDAKFEHLSDRIDRMKTARTIAIALNHDRAPVIRTEQTPGL